ncbi:hypothetical protein LJC04_06655 [Ruminococcaceae bacterium OttesenSCG-928-O06]|nr:hypothetical protein [Ruminococcaceae bacterium OttesenSCG-928-O06]
MKKPFVLMLALLLLPLCACAAPSAMQQATGASARQARAIEDVLHEAGAEYEQVEAGSMLGVGVTSATQEKYPYYVLCDADGTPQYALLLDGETYEVLWLGTWHSGETLYGEMPLLPGAA